jgi:hypothetical protein
MRFTDVNETSYHFNGDAYAVFAAALKHGGVKAGVRNVLAVRTVPSGTYIETGP